MFSQRTFAIHRDGFSLCQGAMLDAKIWLYDRLTNDNMLQHFAAAVHGTQGYSREASLHLLLRQGPLWKRGRAWNWQVQMDMGFIQMRLSFRKFKPCPP